MVWKCMMLINRVSTNCATGRGAVTRMKRLVGKADCAFREGVDVAGEPEFSEIVDEVVAKASGAFKPVDLGSRKAQRLEINEDIVKSGRKEEIASSRQPSDEEFEYRRLVLAAIQISLDHVEFIKVGGERAGRRRHVGPGRTNVVLTFARPAKTGQMPGGRPPRLAYNRQKPHLVSRGTQHSLNEAWRLSRWNRASRRVHAIEKDWMPRLLIGVS